LVSAASSRYWSCAVSAAVFVERGYAAAAMETIAARAQVSVPTLYGTFGGKRQILSALILGLKDEADVYASRRRACCARGSQSIRPPRSSGR
jgi:AcrR family transcriptional regulator